MKTLELPDNCFDAIKAPRQEVPDRLKRELALRLYEKDLLTFGKARELAGLSKWEFHELLSQEGINRHYDVEELDDDLQTLQELQ